MEPETMPLDEVARALAEERLEGAPRLSLLVHHPGGAGIVALEPGQAVVIGREEPADCIVHDPSVSRRHARFTCGPEGEDEVEVEDLGARNGTWFHGDRITRTVLRPGDEVLMGSVVVEVHARASGRVSTPLAAFASASPSASASARLEGEALPVAASPAMRRVFDEVERAASSLIPVLLQGETGTGKEVVARALHGSGTRRHGRMVCINCAAIPEPLVESTLFGHERGAFTGADEQRTGAFEEASGGTLLLDEIGDLPAPAQAALLRVLETRRVMRVGSTRELEVDVRVVAATNRDLESMVREGRFREDLLYRLNGLTITLPPLRLRLPDIRPLAERFLLRATESAGRGPVAVDDAVFRALEAYAWPGNVRELRNAIERAVVVVRGHTITLNELPERVRPSVGAAVRDTEPDAPASSGTRRATEIRARVLGYEGKMIEEALRTTFGNQTEAARLLNMPLRTLVRKIRVLGLRPR